MVVALAGYRACPNAWPITMTGWAHSPMCAYFHPTEIAASCDGEGETNQGGDRACAGLWNAFFAAEPCAGCGDMLPMSLPADPCEEEIPRDTEPAPPGEEHRPRRRLGAWARLMRAHEADLFAPVALERVARAMHGASEEHHMQRRMKRGRGRRRIVWDELNEEARTLRRDLARCAVVALVREARSLERMKSERAEERPCIWCGDVGATFVCTNCGGDQPLAVRAVRDDATALGRALAAGVLRRMASEHDAALDPKTDMITRGINAGFAKQELEEAARLVAGSPDAWERRGWPARTPEGWTWVRPLSHDVPRGVVEWESEREASAIEAMRLGGDLLAHVTRYPPTTTYEVALVSYGMQEGARLADKHRERERRRDERGPARGGFALAARDGLELLADEPPHADDCNRPDDHEGTCGRVCGERHDSGLVCDLPESHGAHDEGAGMHVATAGNDRVMWATSGDMLYRVESGAGTKAWSPGCFADKQKTWTMRTMRPCGATHGSGLACDKPKGHERDPEQDAGHSGRTARSARDGAVRLYWLRPTGPLEDADGKEVYASPVDHAPVPFLGERYWFGGMFSALPPTRTSQTAKASPWTPGERKKLFGEAVARGALPSLENLRWVVERTKAALTPKERELLERRFSKEPPEVPLVHPVETPRVGPKGCPVTHGSGLLCVISPETHEKNPLMGHGVWGSKGSRWWADPNLHLFGDGIYERILWPPGTPNKPTWTPVTGGTNDHVGQNPTPEQESRDMVASKNRTGRTSTVPGIGEHKVSGSGGLREYDDSSAKKRTFPTTQDDAGGSSDQRTGTKHGYEVGTSGSDPTGDRPWTVVEAVQWFVQWSKRNPACDTVWKDVLLPGLQRLGNRASDDPDERTDPAFSAEAASLLFGAVYDTAQAIAAKKLVLTCGTIPERAEDARAFSFARARAWAVRATADYALVLRAVAVDASVEGVQERCRAVVASAVLAVAWGEYARLGPAQNGPATFEAFVRIANSRAIALRAELKGAES